MLRDLVRGGLRRSDSDPRRSRIVAIKTRSARTVTKSTPGQTTEPSSSGAKKRLVRTLNDGAQGLLRLEDNEGQRGPVASSCIEDSFVLQNARIRGLEMVSVERKVSLGTVIRRTFHSYVRGCRDGCNALMIAPRRHGSITSLFSS